MGDQFSYDKVPGHKFGIKQSKLECILKKKLGIFSSIFKSVKSPASGFRTVRISKICRTSKRNVMSGRVLVIPHSAHQSPASLNFFSKEHDIIAQSALDELI